MIVTIVVILVVLWALGLATAYKLIEAAQTC